MVNISEREKNYPKTLDYVLRHFFDENGRKFGGEGADNYESLVKLKVNLERQLKEKGDERSVADLFIWGYGEEKFFILPVSVSENIVDGFLVSDGVRRRLDYSFINTIGRFPPKDAVGIVFSTEVENLYKENVLNWVISQGLSEEELDGEVEESKGLSIFDTFRIKDLPEIFDSRYHESSVLDIPVDSWKDDRI